MTTLSVGLPANPLTKVDAQRLAELLSVVLRRLLLTYAATADASQFYCRLTASSCQQQAAWPVPLTLVHKERSSGTVSLKHKGFNKHNLDTLDVVSEHQRAT
jgi:hypothetical protein